MKIERLHEYVIPAVATLGGMFLAVYLGSLTGKGSMGAMSVILITVLCITLCITLRAKTWILIALTWDLTGQMPITNLPLAVREMAVGFVVVSYLTLYALKVIGLQAKVDWIDLLLGLILLCLVTVYIRNPVGVAAFGSQKVGGKPYFDVVIALLAYAVLSRAPVDRLTLRRLPIYLLAGTAVSSLGSLVTYIFPRSVNYLGELYAGFAPQEGTQENDATSRKQGLSVGSNTAMRLLCSYFPPITLISPVYIWRFCAAMLCFSGVLLSGFRSSFITVIMYAVVGSYFRRRIRDIILMTCFGCVAIGFLGLANGRLFNLPLAAQRALTIFPGNWDPLAKADAEQSTQWRLEMWKIVLTEDRYIQNRILGDGYGFTRAELGIMQSEMLGGPGFVGAARQESFMISGVFHSGPLSTIRYVGYVGLAIYTTLLVLLALRGARLIRATENTPFFGPAIFVGMPVLISPVVFFLIAGAFQYNLPDTIFAAGLLKMMERGVRAHQFNAGATPAKVESSHRRSYEPQSLRPAVRV